MNKVPKIVLTLLAMAAVMAYTIFNFTTGKINMVYFLVFMAILCIPFINMVNILIQELKNR